MDETRNALALYARTSTPITEAATSLSRNVCSARPGRERTRFEANQQAAMHSARPRYHSRSACPNGTPRTSRYGESLPPKLKPNSEKAGTRRPLKPPVTQVQVLSTCSPMKTSPSEAMPR